MKTFYKNHLKNFSSNINANEIKIVKASKLHDLPDYSKKFAWGSYHTDHMLEIDHDVKNGWNKPLISEFHNLSIDPRNQTLHYAIELFEGLKAYRNGKDVYLFRPDLNMKRMNNSATRVGLPNFNGEELIKCISKLVQLDERWIHHEKGFSLYIRPTFISMSNVLGVQPATNSKIFVILSPVGPYFPDGMKPIRIQCNEPDYVRACKGGFGSYKLGA